MTLRPCCIYALTATSLLMLTKVWAVSDGADSRPALANSHASLKAYPRPSSRSRIPRLARCSTWNRTAAASSRSIKMEPSCGALTYSKHYPTYRSSVSPRFVTSSWARII